MSFMTPINAIKGWRDKNLLLADLLISVLGTILVFATLMRFASLDDLTTVFKGVRSSIYTTIASISGSLLGFILTAVSIIALFLQSPRFDGFRRAGGDSETFRVYMSAIRWLSIATVWILVALVLDTDDRSLLIVTGITVLVVVIASVRVYRCVWALEKIIEIALVPLAKTQPESHTAKTM